MLKAQPNKTFLSFLRFVLLVTAMAIGVLPTFAQRSGRGNQNLRFEVASVRPNISGNNRGTSGVQRSGRVFMTNMPLRQIIAFAYGIDFQLIRFSLIGGPDKLLDSKFDIQGVPASSSQTDQPPRREESLLMLRALLAERFSLRIRKETRPVPSDVLAVANPAKLGPHLRRSEYNCAAAKATRRDNPKWVPPPALDFDGKPLCTAPNFSQPKPGAVTLGDVGPLEGFIKQSQAFFDRKIVDETGLNGNFEWRITFSINPKNPTTPSNEPDVDVPPIPVAVQSELGLKLEERTRPAEVYVIDSLAIPTPN
jgi:uncharacterized protein (TIGR03435 family)